MPVPTIKNIMFRCAPVQALAVNCNVFQGTDALHAAGAVTVADLNQRTLNTPGFGHTSLMYLTMALAAELLRLQATVDDMQAALDKHRV
jgi:hypothetical protein